MVEYKRLRTSLNKTQEEMADIAGITQSMVSHIENDTREYYYARVRYVKALEKLGAISPDDADDEVMHLIEIM